MQQKILITSALPYANGPLHFGHIAGAYLPGDCYARYQRMRGNDVKYFCGSDEYGVAITMSADIAGRTPKEQVDIYHEMNKGLFEKLNFSFDHYSRTTWEGHKAPTLQFFNDLYANGYIEEMMSDHLYSEADDKFLADRYVVGTCPNCGYDNARGDECSQCATSHDAIELINPRSKLSGAPLVMRSSKHWFLRLDKFRDKMLSWVDSKDWKPNVINFVKQYIEKMHPRAITRDSKWGIPVPLEGAEGKVIYVWFDAPIGYISASMEWAQKQGDPDLWKKYWLDADTKFVQFVGKDNIPFHAVIFPAMIMGQNQPYKLVDELPANEFYNLEGKQFSKSEGWYIDFDDFFLRYTPDQIRYAIAANAPETADSEFTWKDFQMRCNSELLGKYGNFVNRTAVFVQKYCDGKIPDRHDLDCVDVEFLENIKKIVDEIAQHYESFSLRRASYTIMELAHLGNVYFDHKKPWHDVKDPSKKERFETTVSCCLECVKALSVVSAPIIPETAERVWGFLGFQSPMKTWEANDLIVGRELPKPEILFKKVEDDQIAAEIIKLQSMKKEHKIIPHPPLKTMVSYEDFGKLDLRVGMILEAKTIPKSKKLLELLVDVGIDKRTVVAGISKYYTSDELVGKMVAVVVNLQPATIRGVQSQGMVLAGSIDDSLKVLSVEELPPGAIVS